MLILSSIRHVYKFPSRLNVVLARYKARAKQMCKVKNVSIIVCETECRKIIFLNDQINENCGMVAYKHSIVKRDSNVKWIFLSKSMFCCEKSSTNP